MRRQEERDVYFSVVPSHALTKVQSIVWRRWHRNASVCTDVCTSACIYPGVSFLCLLSLCCWRCAEGWLPARQLRHSDFLLFYGPAPLPEQMQGIWGRLPQTDNPCIVNSEGPFCSSYLLKSTVLCAGEKLPCQIDGCVALASRSLWWWKKGGKNGYVHWSGLWKERIYVKVVAVQSIMALMDREVSNMQLAFATDFPAIPADLCYLLIPWESAVIWCGPPPPKWIHWVHFCGLSWREAKTRNNLQSFPAGISHMVLYLPACVLVLTALKMMTCGSLHRGRRVTFLPVYDLLSRRIRSLLEAPKAAGGEATLGRNLTVYMARCGLNRLMSVGQALICCLLLWPWCFSSNVAPRICSILYSRAVFNLSNFISFWVWNSDINTVASK